MSYETTDGDGEEHLGMKSSDTGSKKNKIPTSNSRIRTTRAASKPARYRQSTEVEAMTQTTTKSKKKASNSSDQKKSIAKATAALVVVRNMVADQSHVKEGTGPWTKGEQELFEFGCTVHGWGKWILIEKMIPTRSRCQVKSHAQKFSKHHPWKKKQLEMKHQEHCRMNAKPPPVKGIKDAPRKKNLKRSNTSPTETKPKAKSKKRSKSSESCVGNQNLRASKRLAQTKEVKTPAPMNKEDTDDSFAITKSHRSNAPTPAPEKSLALTAPRKCSQLLAEHSPRSDHGKAAAQMSPVVAAQKPEKRPAPIAQRKLFEKTQVTPGTGAWTPLEQEQFKTGLLMHGWGNWAVIEGCIPTRTNSQVKSHAQKFQKHRPHEKEQIQMEHELRYAMDKKKGTAGKTRVQKPKKKPPKKNRAVESSQSNSCVSMSEQPKLQHVLLGIGKTPKNYSNISLVSTPESNDELVEAASHAGSSQGSSQQTGVDDYGAAEAILALRWDKSKNETDTSRSEETDEISSGDELAIDVPEDANVVTGPRNYDSEGSPETTQTEVVGSQGIDCGTKNMNVKGRKYSNVTPEICSAQTSPVGKDPKITPNNNAHAQNSSQPPPHWLAADTWSECLRKIKLWNNKLSRDEQNMEYLKFERLPGGEKERLRKKLLTLMNNRPLTLRA
mmetsp:Transcript_28967/g.61212  ORF Transcript_28967/g.61212 Transcript_28967/m.61212 type:complete len:668 (-) Transcript_28967:200-2203(-)|eukprot:CAMPEP_0183714150 /NCGR_PEP_ID=MMETSP0737-20130205/8789_1 /TAXON_ID=385413 /ORGANISM="Thalassiosira miniscula, Strain CCMP1093" /LENGTH=667 /DNA_ID=CAMNT_0025943055 /DNA_START=391 /DNA_END=2394 /DNA_ORIENTATION=-